MKTLFLEGGGFPSFWYIFGFGNELMRNTFIYPKKEGISKIGGYSAGAIAAALLCCHDYSSKKLIDMQRVIDVCKACISVYKFGGLATVVRGMLDPMLPENAHELVNDKLVILLCEPQNNYKAKMVRKWKNKKDVIDCIVASTFIPLLSMLEIRDPVYGCIDGGFSMNRTEVIGKEFDIICRYTSSAAYIDSMIPLTEEEVKKTYVKGQLDALFV